MLNAHPAPPAGRGAAAHCRRDAQADLEKNQALQTVLHTREMIQEALRQAMVISENAKPGSERTGVSGTGFYAWGAGAQGQLGQPVVQGQLRRCPPCPPARWACARCRTGWAADR